MRQSNEIVGIEIDDDIREQLDVVLQERMEELGLIGGDYCGLIPGLAGQEAWPLDGEVTLAQLVALAAKLRMAITITGVEMCPLEMLAET